MKDLVVKFNKDSSLQRIKASYMDEKIELSDKENELLEEMKFIFSLRLKNKFTKKQAIEKFISEYKVSTATAYRRYTMSMMLFGELDEADRKAEKVIIADDYRHLYQMALRDRNWELAKKCLDSLKDLYDFSKEDNLMDIDKIKANEYYMYVPKEVLEVMKKESKTGVGNMNLTAEDVGYEELEDE